MEKLRTLELNVVWLVVDTYDEPVGPDCSATPDDEAVLLVRSERCKCVLALNLVQHVIRKESTEVMIWNETCHSLEILRYMFKRELLSVVSVDL